MIKRASVVNETGLMGQESLGWGGGGSSPHYSNELSAQNAFESTHARMHTGE